jgi:hypothetical protein
VAHHARADEWRKRDRAWDLHLNCWTQQAIADEIGEPLMTVHGWITKRELNSDFVNPPASRQHFDVWSFQKADGES